MSCANTAIFILSWDMYGLESCVNATELDMQHTLNLLSSSDDTTRPPELNRIVNHILLRAKFNPQRKYEVYSIQVDSSVTKDDLVQQFEECPQEMADLIRKRGTKIFSERTVDTSLIKIH